MNIEGVEITGFVPNLSDPKSQVIDLVSSYISIGGPNGAGKSEFLRRVDACFTGDATKLGPNINPGILLKVSRDFLQDPEKSRFEDDMFVYAFHEGLVSNFSWKFLRASIEEYPENIEDFESNLAALIALSAKLNFNEQLTLTLKKLSQHVESMHKIVEELTELQFESVITAQAVIDFVVHNVSNNDEFLSEYASKFLESHEILLVPVGSKENPLWNASLVNRHINKDVDAVSCFLYLHTLPNNPFLTDMKSMPDLSVKRDTGAVSVTKFSNRPWLTLNVGRIEARGFAVINPDNITLDELRNALNVMAASAIDWDHIKLQKEPEKKDDFKEQVRRLSDLFEAISEPVTPRMRTTPKFNFLTENEAGETVVNNEVSVWLSEQSETVNSILKSILPTLPEIKLALNRPYQWPTQGIFGIYAHSDQGLNSLESLSQTQQRWIKFILSFSLFYFSARRVILLDEPELGLQRNLEHDLSELISLFADKSLIICSSHSSTFLKAPQVLSVIAEEDGSRKFNSYFGSLYAHLHEFDISEAEYFESFKLIVVTEGERDKAMLEGFAGDLLEKNKILLVAGTGIKSWEGFFTSYIFPMLTSPKIVFLVDGFDPGRMKNSILEARKISYKGHPAVKFHFLDAIPSWNQGAPLGKGLTESFAESLTRAIMSKDSERIYFEATGDRDCIEWLPVSIFPLKESSWDDVWKSAASIKTGNITTGEDFKRYIKNEIKKSNPLLNLKPDSLKEMASMQALHDRIPKRINNLLKRLVEVAQN